MAISAGTLEFRIILILTLITIGFKIIMASYLGMRIARSKRESGPGGTDFMFGMMMFMIALFVSRIFYVIFDFYYTQFDMSVYHLSPNVWFWKMGQLISGLGIAYLIDVVDKKILQRKFKGILTIIMVAGAVMMFVIPIRSPEDFALVSAIGMIPQLGVAIVPFIFIHIAIKSTGELRQTAWMIVIASILLAISAIIVNAGIVSALNNLVAPNSVDVYIYLVQTISKIISYLLFVLASSRFKI
jgi:hypothetical protein